MEKKTVKIGSDTYRLAEKQDAPIKDIIELGLKVAKAALIEDNNTTI